MKKIIIGALAVGCLLLAGCGKTVAPEESPVVDPADVAATVIKPVEATLSADKLDNTSFSAGFESKDVYLNDDGALVVDLTVYDYERFSAADVAALKEGDTLLINGKELVIDTLERGDNGFVTINGGFEEGGCWLGKDGDDYREVLEDDAKSFFEVGKATLPIGQDFVFTDNSDPEAQGKTLLAGDFLQEIPKTEVTYSPNAITVTMKDGFIVSMERKSIP